MSALVVITDSNLPSDGAEERELAAAGFAVRREACRSEDDVIAAAADADAVIVQWAPLGPRAFAALPRLRMVSRLGIGYDMIDVEAATELGIAVANTPDYCIEEVALHTLALLLACTRGVVALDADIRSGRWDAVGSYPAACRPSGTTVGVVGYGRIGRRVAAAAVAIGFRVLVSDPFAEIAADGLEAASLEELLARSDVVTLHAPLTAATRHLIAAPSLALMRPGSYLVNTCRGGLVDEAALAAALASGQLAGAALDVFEQEPLSQDSPLRQAPGVILTPHAAWYSPAALVDLPVLAARNVADFLAGRKVAAIINPDYLAVAR